MRMFVAVLLVPTASLLATPCTDDDAALAAWEVERGMAPAGGCANVPALLASVGEPSDCSSLHHEHRAKCCATCRGCTSGCTDDDTFLATQEEVLKRPPSGGCANIPALLASVGEPTDCSKNPELHENNGPCCATCRRCPVPTPQPTPSPTSVEESSSRLLMFAAAGIVLF